MEYLSLVFLGSRWCINRVYSCLNQPRGWEEIWIKYKAKKTSESTMRLGRDLDQPQGWEEIWISHEAEKRSGSAMRLGRDLDQP